MINDNETLLAIDIGTTKVCAIAAVRNERNVIQVLGMGIHPCAGLSAGGIQDMEEIVSAVSNACHKALNEAPDIGIPRAVVGISGTFIQSHNTTGSVVLSRHGRAVTSMDVDQCIDAAIRKSVPRDYDVLHAIPRWFRLDDSSYIRDPVGMEGSVLEVEAHLLIGRQNILKNIRRCVNKAGFSVEEIACQPIVSSEAVLTEEEKDTGIALVEIGGETTSIVVYYEGSIYHSEILGIGGVDITRDINHYFQTPIENAENLKKYSGSTLLESIDPEETIEVVRFKNRRTIVAKKLLLCEIIEARVEHILEEVLRSLRTRDLLGCLFGGIVLSGGSSLLEGIREKTQSMMHRDTHIGYPNGVVGLEEIITSPSYANAIGLLHYGFERRDLYQEFYGTGIKRMIRKLLRWAQEAF
ncbi:MAG: cell division protein FtsA [bacterium]